MVFSIVVVLLIVGHDVRGSQRLAAVYKYNFVPL